MVKRDGKTVPSRNVIAASLQRPALAAASRWRRAVRFLVLLCLGGGLAALGPALWWLAGTPEQHVVAYLQGQLLAASDDEAPKFLHRFARLGERGIAPLVEAVGSTRAVVAHHAQAMLHDKLALWRSASGQDSQGADEFQRQRQLLAKALASRVSSFGPNARDFAARLALRLLASSPSGRGTDLVEHCDTILRVAGLPNRSVVIEHGLRAAERGFSSLDRVTSVLINPADVLTTLPQVPGGGIDLPHVQPPGDSVAAQNLLSPPDADASAVPSAEVGTTLKSLPIYERRSFRERWGNPTGPLQEWARAGQAEAPSDRPDGSTGAVDGPTRAVDVPTGVVDIPSPDVMAGREKQLSKASLQNVMGLLHDDDRFVVKAAEDELRRRGMSDTHVALARLVTDSRAQVRRHLVERLHSVSGIDLRPWLLMLAEDTDDQTRLAALTMLATSGNPVMLERVRQMALRDPNPRIAAIAERLLLLSTEAESQTNGR